MPSFEREISASEAEVSQSNETMIETVSKFDNVSSVRCRETVCFDATQNDNEMQMWTQKMEIKTNIEKSEMRNKRRKS